MTSRFVSRGTIDAATGEAVPSQGSENAGTTTSSDSSAATKEGVRQGEWAAVQAQLDAERKQREEERRRAADAHGAGSGDRSLFEVLQANKAAKQAEFEEKNKIKNQFRALDDDEVDFLDGVRSGEKEREERVRRETEEGLEAFRAKQRSKETQGRDAEGDGEEEEEEGGGEEEGESWAVAAGRKRKREKDKEGRAGIKGLKRRTSDPMKQMPEKSEMERLPTRKEDSEQRDPTPSSAPAKKAPDATAKPKLGLVEYGSDDEDGDD